MERIWRNNTSTMVGGARMFNSGGSFGSTTDLEQCLSRQEAPQRGITTATGGSFKVFSIAEDNTNDLNNDIDKHIILQNSEDSFSADKEESTKQLYLYPYKYVAEISYDGTRYSGFQLQRASWKTPTIQGLIERALGKFIGLPREELSVQGAARTDSGVHARGQAVHFLSSRLLESTDRAVLALNSVLPEDIRVLRVLRVPLDYNVRFSNGKIYTYDLHLEQIADPFLCRYRFHPPRPDKINLDILSSATGAFLGTHDFSVFSSKPRDGSKRSPMRTIQKCEVARLDPGGCRITVQGDGFLYKQVRHMVGAMLSAAVGRITPEDIAAALKDPIGRGGGVLAHPGAYKVAEPQGLCLTKVFLLAPGDPEKLMYGVEGAKLRRREERGRLI